MSRKSSEAERERRREVVARLLVRGLSERAITAALAEHGFVSPTGRPWGRTSVQRDIEAVRQQWRAAATADIAVHVEGQLATLREVQREAWKNGDGDLVLKAHDRMAKLLGTDAAQKVEVSGGMTIALESLASAADRLDRAFGLGDDDGPESTSAIGCAGKIPPF